MTYEATEWFTTNPAAKTCDQKRIQLRVGSLASEIDKFHDRLPLSGVIEKKITMVKILHIVRVPHACGGECGEFNWNVWDVIVGIKRPRILTRY